MIKWKHYKTILIDMIEYIKHLIHFRKQIRGMFKDWSFDGSKDICYTRKDSFVIWFGGSRSLFDFCFFKDWTDSSAFHVELFVNKLNTIERFLVFLELRKHLYAIEHPRAELEKLKKKEEQTERKLSNYKNRLDNFLKKATGIDININCYKP